MTDTQPTKAVIYARVSSPQQKTQGHGLDSQEMRCREFATYRGYEVVEVFRDDISGKYTERPGMKAMKAFLHKHRHDPHVVIIDDISRLARGVEAHIQLRTAISAASGILQSPSIEFGEDSDSVLVENLLASVSQHQRQKNGEQTKNRMRARAQAGYWCFPAPVGYRFETVRGHGKLLVPDEPAATILRQAFEGYASGRFETQAEVCRFLSGRPEYPHLQRQRLTTERVREMMTRPTYAGYLTIPVWNVHLVPAKHEPIISFETYQAVQRRMNGAANAPQRRNLNEDFPLRGFITCGCCGHALMGCWSTGRSARHPYYLCQRNGCDAYGKSIRRDVIEGEFEALLMELKPTRELFDLAHDMFRDLWDGNLAMAKVHAVALEASLKKIDRDVGQFLDRVVEADSPTIIKAYEKRIRALEEEKALVREQIAKCGRPLKDFDSTFRTAMDFLGNPYNLWVSDSLDDKRAVLKLTFADRLSYVRGEGVDFH